MSCEKDLNQGVKILRKALKGFPGVTFSLELNAYWFDEKNHFIHSKVTLWFYHTFPRVVTGGADFKLLAIHARDAAQHALLVIKKKKRCPKDYHAYTVSERSHQEHITKCVTKKR